MQTVSSYGVELCKQNIPLCQTLGIYRSAVRYLTELYGQVWEMLAGIPDAKLEWHPRHAACRAFTLEEYTGLILAVKNFVYPYVQQCQVLKEQIYNAKTVEELKAVKIVYEKADKGIV